MSSDVQSSLAAMSRNVSHCPAGEPRPGACELQPPAGLSDKQRTALEAMLGGTSVARAAREIGVDRRTLFRWRRECEPFRAELAQRRREMWIGATDRLRAMVGRSLRVLDRQLHDTYPDTRYRAAAAVLRLANVRKLAEEEMKEARTGEPRMNADERG